MADPEIVYGPLDAADPANEAHIEAVVRWSTSESMIPINTFSIQRYRFPNAAFADNTQTGEREIAGYAAITHIYSRRVIELGGLVINPKYRGLGIASELVKKTATEAREHLEPEQILAFSNHSSGGLFSKLGGERIEDADTLPPEVWKACHVCRFYEKEVIRCGKICCGRVFDITRIEE